MGRDVGEREAVRRLAATTPSPMCDEIDLEKARSVAIPVGEGTYRDVVLEQRSRSGYRPPARQGGVTGRRERTIRCRRPEHGLQSVSRDIERQFTVAFERVNHFGQSWHEPFPAIRSAMHAQSERARGRFTHEAIRTIDEGRSP